MCNEGYCNRSVCVSVCVPVFLGNRCRSEGETWILWCVLGSSYARYSKILERRRLHTMAGQQRCCGSKECALIEDRDPTKFGVRPVHIPRSDEQRVKCM